VNKIQSTNQKIYDVCELYNDSFFATIQKIKHDIDNNISCMVICTKEQLKERAFYSIIARCIIQL
jgi:hypothetical protein